VQEALARVRSVVFKGFKIEFRGIRRLKGSNIGFSDIN
jgi:hypothetical protein